MKNGFLAVLGVAALAFGGPVFAATQWSLTTGNNNVVTWGNERQYSSDGIDLTATAWSNTGAGGAIQDAYLPVWSGGLGVMNRNENGTSPNHSTDNYGYYDSILFTFSDLIALQSVQLGWTYRDSDITVLAYTGAGTPSLAGASYDNLLASGWSLIGHYANLATNVPRAVNAGEVASSYWLIGAYNPLVGNSAGWTTGDDYTKISSLTGVKVTPPPPSNPVSEPGSLALAGLAMLGLIGMRRRRHDGQPG